MPTIRQLQRSLMAPALALLAFGTAACAGGPPLQTPYHEVNGVTYYVETARQPLTTDWETAEDLARDWASEKLARSISERVYRRMDESRRMKLDEQASVEGMKRGVDVIVQIVTHQPLYRIEDLGVWKKDGSIRVARGLPVSVMEDLVKQAGSRVKQWMAGDSDGMELAPSTKGQGGQHEDS